jgi:hypothetical protein
MSHEMLHHAELQIFFELLHMFDLFEIETWFEFELKTLEKINRKSIRNSLKMEKPNSAQLAQAGPTRACARARALARADRRPHLSACSARSLSPLSPSCCLVGQSCRLRFPRTRARSLSLARGPHQLDPSSLTSRPRTPVVDAPSTARFPATSARPRPIRARTPLVHFPHSFAPTAELSRPLSRPAHTTRQSAAAHRSSPPVPRPSLSPRRTRSLGKLCHITRSSRHPSVRHFPLWFARSTLTGSLPQLRRRRPVPSPCPGHRSCVPGTSLKVTVLAPPLFSPVSHLPAHDCSPEYSPVRRGLPSAVRSPQSHSHKPDHAIVIARPSPTSLATWTNLSRPRRPSLPRLRRRRRRARGERRPGFLAEIKFPSAHPVRPTLIGRPDFN